MSDWESTWASICPSLKSNELFSYPVWMSINRHVKLLFQNILLNWIHNNHNKNLIIIFHIRKTLLALSPVLCRSAQAQQPKPLNIIVNSLAILIQQCRAHTSNSFFAHISSDSCNKTYCSVNPLTFSGNTKAYLDVLLSCSNDLGSCTEIIPCYKQRKQLLLASERAAAIETRTTVFTKVNRGDHITVVEGTLSMVLCLIAEF